MPLYEYECEACGQVFEVIQKFSDQPLATHAGCGGPVHRLVSASAFHFKGSGWYVTDYAKGGGNKPEAGAPAPNGEAKSEPKSGAKGEGKPPASTDSKSSGESKSSSESKPAAPASSSTKSE